MPILIPGVLLLKGACHENPFEEFNLWLDIRLKMFVCLNILLGLYAQ